MTALGPLVGLIVIHEVQRRPDLFPVLRVLADRRARAARFLILGSATGDPLRQSSESLAGRVERITIGGFSLAELRPGVRVAAAALQRFWTILAHDHGQIWNAAEPARALATCLHRREERVRSHRGRSHNGGKPARRRRRHQTS